MPKKAKPTCDIDANDHAGKTRLNTPPAGLVTPETAPDAFKLDHNPAVEAWAKNDHLGFEILYIYRGVVCKYRPDWLIRLTNDDVWILETKGQDTDQNQAKHNFLALMGQRRQRVRRVWAPVVGCGVAAGGGEGCVDQPRWQPYRRMTTLRAWVTT